MGIIAIGGLLTSTLLTLLVVPVVSSRGVNTSGSVWSVITSYSIHYTKLYDKGYKTCAIHVTKFRSQLHVGFGSPVDRYIDADSRHHALTRKIDITFPDHRGCASYNFV